MYIYNLKKYEEHKRKMEEHNHMIKIIKKKKKKEDKNENTKNIVEKNCYSKKNENCSIFFLFRKNDWNLSHRIPKLNVKFTK
jgi:hypothetical protein